MAQVEDIFGKKIMGNTSTLGSLTGSVTAKVTWLLTAAPAKRGMALPQPRLGNSPVLESAAP